jgi:hypothetical protein
MLSLWHRQGKPIAVKCRFKWDVMQFYTSRHPAYNGAILNFGLRTFDFGLTKKFA